MKNIRRYRSPLVSLVAALALAACVADTGGEEVDGEAFDEMGDEIDTERYTKPKPEPTTCTYYKTIESCGILGDCYYWYSTVESDNQICGDRICECDDQP